MDWLCCLTSNMNKAISPQFHKTLNALIEALIKPETLKRDLFFAVLLIVIKENDFVLKGNREIDVLDYILTKKRDDDKVREVCVVLNRYGGCPVNVIVCSLDGALLINAFIDAAKDTHSICVPIDEYMETSSLGIPSSFRQLPDLVNSLREKIVIPMKASVLSYYKQPSCSLQGLPNNVLYQIFVLLSLNDILNVGRSCKKLSEVVKDENVWSRLLRRDFPKIRNNKEADWRNLYKKAYAKKSKRNDKKASSVRGYATEQINEWPNFLPPVKGARLEVIL
ncbi:hypothetical protein HF086_002447 [Spodoptera exigua]|uniref:F-box domain-containing protein n=1 Tax=Spodoptera exigua TaxID=7107 RepID=A0A922MGZ9_SPOEX|nr:hypothetical protein HF086_002447 [Spodoptera exigua]